MILIASFGLGLVHALEVDHLAAVSTFVASKSDPRRAIFLGMKWAIGHGISLLLFGSLLFALKLAVPASTAHALERAVGVSLLALGIWTLVRPDHTHRQGSMWMGMLHGLAGTAAFVGQSLVVMSKSYLFVFIYTAAFSTGVLVAMALYAFALGHLLNLRVMSGARTFMALWACALGLFWVFR